MRLSKRKKLMKYGILSTIFIIAVFGISQIFSIYVWGTETEVGCETFSSSSPVMCDEPSITFDPIQNDGCHELVACHYYKYGPGYDGVPEGRVLVENTVDDTYWYNQGVSTSIKLCYIYDITECTAGVTTITTTTPPSQPSGTGMPWFVFAIIFVSFGALVLVIYKWYK